MDTILLVGLVILVLLMLVRALAVLAYANSREYRTGIALRRRLGGM